jgi:hypothetical protein
MPNENDQHISVELITHADEVGRTCLNSCKDCINNPLASYSIIEAEPSISPNGLRVNITCADANQYHVDVFKKARCYQYVLSDLLRAESLDKLQSAIDTHVRSVHLCYRSAEDD